MTPMETSTKAARVPMFTSSPSVTSGRKNASSPAATPVMIVILCGVRKVRWTRENQGGSRLSRLIAKATRLWPSTRIITTTGRPYEDRQRDDQPRCRERCRFEGRSRRGRGSQRLVGHEPRKDDGGQDVENRADRQGGQNADGQISLGIARLLGGGGHDVETYVGEENQRRRREDACYAVYGVYPQKARQEVHLELLPPRLRRRDEGGEVRRRYEEYPEANDEQRNEDFDRCDHRVELRAQLYPYDQN